MAYEPYEVMFHRLTYLMFSIIMALALLQLLARFMHGPSLL
jgi:hypothetical protein